MAVKPASGMLFEHEAVDRFVPAPKHEQVVEHLRLPDGAIVLPGDYSSFTQKLPLAITLNPTAS